MVDTAFYQNKGPFCLNYICKLTGAVMSPDADNTVKIRDIAPMETAVEGEICFFYDKKAKAKASEMKASACVTTEELKNFVPAGVVVLVHPDPKTAFLTLNQAFYAEYAPQAGVAASAKIHPSAKIGQGCFVGENVVVEENAVVGDGCRLEAGCYIGRGCVLGNNCRIGVNAYVSYTKMGDNCFIFSGARLGTDGFGFQLVNGQHVRIPQVGLLLLGNDVEVGANTCIDRGALGNTIIGDGCRIDNLVQIAHNDKMGRGCVIVSQTGIAGSCTFGDYVVTGGQAGIADHIHIGSGAQVAAQSGIMRDIEPQTVVMGSPAVPFKDYMRQVAFLQKNSKK